MLNRLSRKLQSRFQGIPPIATHIYKFLAVRVISKLHELVAEEVAELIGSRSYVVDVGCGTGSSLSKLGRLCGLNHYLVGLDISRAMVKIARSELSKLDRIFDIVLGDAHELPFRDSSISIIVSTGTLHHLPKPRKFFLECLRILKVGGKALIYEFSSDASPTELLSTAKEFKKPAPLLKLLSKLHGIPRKKFLSGWLSRELVGIKHGVISKGLATELVLIK